MLFGKMKYSIIGLLLAGGLLGLRVPAAAQGAVRCHLVYFRDKTGTPFRVDRPEAFLSARSLSRRSRQGLAVRARDLPVNPAYVARVRAVAGAPELRYTSRWLNAAVVACDSGALARVRALPEVSGTQTLSLAPTAASAGTAHVVAARPAVPNRVLTTAGPAGAWPALTSQDDRATYGKAYGQDELLGAVAMHAAGFRGEGVRIAVLDAGFPGVNTIAALASLQSQGRLAGTRNFVDGGPNVFTRASHGTACLSTLAANQPGFFIGTAPQATYYLCITEDATSERPIEEANWLAAAEYADSAGVDIISSSLGYNLFDAPARSYTYADFDGHTSLSTRAAVEAARVGMLAVVSAGNEGQKTWHYITAPADADSIITVGAVDSLRFKAGFSSFGPTADGRLKPTLAAQGVQTAILTPSGVAVRGNGTSFACPTLAGLAAGFWQAHPQLSAQEVISYLTRSASQAMAPDNSLGYGIPNFTVAQVLVAAPVELQLFPNPLDGSGVLRLRLPAAYPPGQELRVRISDARGALVRDFRLPAATGDIRLLPVGMLAGGLYHCQLISAAGQPTRSVRFVQP